MPSLSVNVWKSVKGQQALQTRPTTKQWRLSRPNMSNGTYKVKTSTTRARRTQRKIPRQATESSSVYKQHHHQKQNKKKYIRYTVAETWNPQDALHEQTQTAWQQHKETCFCSRCTVMMQTLNTDCTWWRWSPESTRCFQKIPQKHFSHRLH